MQAGGWGSIQTPAAHPNDSQNPCLHLPHLSPPSHAHSLFDSLLNDGYGAGSRSASGMGFDSTLAATTLGMGNLGTYAYLRSGFDSGPHT